MTKKPAKIVIASRMQLRFYEYDGWTKEELDRMLVVTLIMIKIDVALPRTFTVGEVFLLCDTKPIWFWSGEIIIN